MSLQNITETNDYDLQANSITINKLISGEIEMSMPLPSPPATGSTLITINPANGIESLPNGAEGEVLKIVGGDLAFGTDTGSNSMSNVGTGGVGVYKQTVGTNFEIKKINGDTNIIIVDDVGNDEVDVTLNTTVSGLTSITSGNVNLSSNSVSSTIGDLLLESASDRIGIKYLGALAGSETLTFRDDVVLDRWGFRYEDDAGTQCMMNLLTDGAGATRIALWGYYAGSLKTNALTTLAKLTVSGANTFATYDLPHALSSYAINSNTVLTATNIGTGVINSNLQNLGTLTELQCDNLNMNFNTLSSTNLNGNIELVANGSGNINCAGDVNVQPDDMFRTRGDLPALDIFGMTYKTTTGNECLIFPTSDSASITRFCGGYFGSNLRVNAFTEKFHFRYSNALDTILQIDGNDVLSKDTLQPSVVSSSLTSLGTLTSLQVDNINVNGNIINADSGNLTLNSTFGRVRTDNTLTVRDHGKDSGYALSVQDGAIAGFTYIEMLNSNDTVGEGCFIGVGFDGLLNQFEYWNYAGGNHEWYVSPIASSGTIKYRMKNNGVFQVVDLTSAGGIVQTDATGNFSSSQSFNISGNGTMSRLLTSSGGAFIQSTVTTAVDQSIQFLNTSVPNNWHLRTKAGNAGFFIRDERVALDRCEFDTAGNVNIVNSSGALLIGGVNKVTSTALDATITSAPGLVLAKEYQNVYIGGQLTSQNTTTKKIVYTFIFPGTANVDALASIKATVFVPTGDTMDITIEDEALTVYATALGVTSGLAIQRPAMIVSIFPATETVLHVKIRRATGTGIVQCYGILIN